jgi:hypothetical protein
MNRTEEHDEKDDLGDLLPMVDAVRGDLPSDAQWNEAHRRLRERLLPSETAALPPEQKAQPGEKAFSHRNRERRFWIGLSAGVSSLCLTLAILYFVLQPSLQPSTSVEMPPAGLVAHAEMVQGSCSRINMENESVPLTSGAALSAGDRIVVDRDAQMSLRTMDGSRIWLYSGTEAVCTSLRSSSSPTLRLMHGEALAEIVRSSKETFTIDTPLAALRVMGTEFYLRVMPGLGQEIPLKEKIMRRPSSISLSGAIMVLTVLSGSVAVEAAGQEKVVQEGQQAIVSNGGGQTTTKKIENLGFIKNWMSKRIRKTGEARPDEVLVIVDKKMVQSLLAFNPKTGNWRHVTDLVGDHSPDIVRLSPDVALVTVGTLTSPWRYHYPAGKFEKYHEDIWAYLVDLRSGESLYFAPMKHYRPLQIKLSPDWRQASFFNCISNSMESDSYLLNIETLKAALVPEHLDHLTWSPDSRWLAGMTPLDQNTRFDIRLFDTMTGQMRNTTWQGWFPKFSPDGKTLAYMGDFIREQGCPCIPRQLFLAQLPNGPAKQITHLEERRIEDFSFSPDGTKLLIWSSLPYHWRHFDDKTLHEVDLKSGKVRDLLISRLEFQRWPAFHWIDEGSQFIMTRKADASESAESGSSETAPGDRTIVTLYDLRGEKPAISNIEVPKEFYRVDGPAKTIIDRLAQAVKTSGKADREEVLYRFDSAQSEYAKTRDLFAETMKDLADPQKSGGLTLKPDALAPYQDHFAEKASLGAGERAVHVVWKNLDSRLPHVLGRYYAGFFVPLNEGESWQTPEGWMKLMNKRLDPPQRLDFEECAREFPGKFLVGNEECIRRYFHIPGEDPEKTLTSFEIVRRDGGDGVITIRTPVLPNGKRLEATYRAKLMRCEGTKSRSVEVKPTVREVE